MNYVDKVHPETEVQAEKDEASSPIKNRNSLCSTLNLQLSIFTSIAVIVLACGLWGLISSKLFRIPS